MVPCDGPGTEAGSDLCRRPGLQAVPGAAGRDAAAVPGADTGVLSYGGLTLAELGREAGGMDYSAATARLVAQAKKNRPLRKAMALLKAKCEK